MSVVRVSLGRIWTLCAFAEFVCNIDVPYQRRIRVERMGVLGVTLLHGDRCNGCERCMCAVNGFRWGCDVHCVLHAMCVWVCPWVCVFVTVVSLGMVFYVSLQGLWFIVLQETWVLQLSGVGCIGAVRVVTAWLYACECVWCRFAVCGVCVFCEFSV